MKKLLCLLVLSLSLSGCSNLRPFTSNATVNDRIVNIYYASTSIANETGKVFGAGTIIKNQAGKKIVVLTAAHVVVAMLERNMPLRITTAYSFNLKQVALIKIDVAKDLALLEGIENERFDGPFVKISNTTPRIGDNVDVIGAPMGEERTFTNGVVSNTQTTPEKTVYRVSAPVFFGNSGGGLFNKDGELIGVAHAIAMIGGFIVVPGAAYFISLETIKKFI